MPRSIATATISFGLVSIPVRLFAATQATSAVSFNLLHDKCGTRVKQQYVCPLDNEIVPLNGLDFGTFTPNGNAWGIGSGTATGTNGGNFTTIGTALANQTGIHPWTSDFLYRHLRLMQQEVLRHGVRK